MFKIEHRLFLEDIYEMSVVVVLCCGYSLKILFFLQKRMAVKKALKLVSFGQPDDMVETCS
jgi:hypothetical protein